MSAIENLLKTIEKLRAPDGCPWDREQTHKSLCDCLVEEAAEFLEAVDLGEKNHMCEELGDLLLQVVMHAQIASENGDFDFEDVAKNVDEKMIRRHPHVFGEISLKNSDEVLKKWDEIKAKENAAGTPKNAAGTAKSPLFKEVPASLNNILKARAAWKSIEKKSLDFGETLDRSRIEKLSENLSEEAAGKMLFEIVAACRKSKIDPDSALRRHIEKVIFECEKNSHGNDKTS